MKKHTLTYWKAPSLWDHNCYSIRAKTKKECKRLLEAEGGAGEYHGEIEKVVVEYEGGAFGLMMELIGYEGGADY